MTVVGFGPGMSGRWVDLDDLIDAQGVADVLGLAQRNTVSLYQRRYPDMPRPVVDLGSGRCRMWLRSEIEDWARARSGRSIHAVAPLVDEEPPIDGRSQTDRCLQPLAALGSCPLHRLWRRLSR